jgi:hypothetical protein
VNFSVNDEVVIVSEKARRAFGVSISDSFVVRSTTNGLVKLNNGLEINEKHLELKHTQPAVRSKPLDAQLCVLVDGVVAELVDDETMFTVFDVTTLLRKQNPKLDISHDKVRILVEDTYADYDLERTLVDIGTAIKPWLYHSEDQDTSDYNRTNTTVDQPKKFTFTFI